MTSSKILFYFCVSFILGIFLESLVYNLGPEFVKNRALYMVLGFFIVGILIILAACFLKKSSFLVLGFCVLVLVLGIMRFQISEYTIKNNILQKVNDTKNTVTLIGVVAAEPDIRDTFHRLKVTAKQLTINDKQIDVQGDVLVTLSVYKNYRYLDQLELTGKLTNPKIYDDFNYKDYLLKDGVYSLMYYPKVSLITVEHQYNTFTYFYEKILFLKEKLIGALDANFTPPHNFILDGIVYGNDKNMPAELKNEFNVTGLSHLTAVSGSNIVILISIVMAFLLFLGMWRGQAFYVSAAFIWVYILLVGLPISGVRAAIMGSIALLAGKLGRQNTSSRVLVLAAFLMLWQNPMLLFYDVSFQLSFLASLGIIYLKPLIDIYVKIILKDKFKGLCDIISVTAAAQILTLPVIVYNFGTISLVAPITNILVLPIIPVLTILGFLVSIFGIYSSFLGWFFSVPCWLLSSYLIKVLDIFSAPWASKKVENVSWFWLVLYYAVLFIFIKVLEKLRKPTFLGY